MKTDNAIVLQRSGDDLFITRVLGKRLQEDLEQMKDALGEKPFVSLRNILDENGQDLCQEEGEGRYQFTGGIRREAFTMTRWVRTAAGHCCQQESRQAQRLTKALGTEFLTDQEFFYQRGLGGYQLSFVKGFNHKICENQKVVEEITLSTEATLTVLRDQGEGQDFISVQSTNSPELANLLKKAGVDLYGETEEGMFLFNSRYQDGPGWKCLPIPLANSLKMAFGRMKASEGGDKNR